MFHTVKSLIVLVGSTALLLFSNMSAAKAQCLISEQKKSLISRLLCGDFAPASDAAYKFVGRDCVRKSITKRLQDSAVQVQIYSLCGEADFSNKLAQATVKSYKFIESLSVCAGERFDLEAIFTDEMSRVSQKLGGQKCSIDTKNMTESRRAFFEQQISTANEPGIELQLFEKLQVKVNPDGSIVELP